MYKNDIITSTELEDDPQKYNNSSPNKKTVFMKYKVGDDDDDDEDEDD